MDKNKYIQAATLMLSDKKTYEPLKKDPTNTIHNKVNNAIKLWNDKNYINEITANSLKSSNPLPARFYGLPKIHKLNFPLRPIVSFCGSPTYNLASFYNNIISNNITPPISRIKNSSDFIEKIKNIEVPLNHKIISLDAVSLFTNVQIGIAIKGIKERWLKIQPHAKMPWYQFEKGLRICSSNSSFNFQNTSYKQKSGFPMGSPLSPIAADIVMDDLETKCIASLPLKLLFFFWYVDVIITAVPTDKIDTILNTFNSYNHKIQFTIEEESDGKICFLDVLIIRDEKKIKTNW